MSWQEWVQFDRPASDGFIASLFTLSRWRLDVYPDGLVVFAERGDGLDTQDGEIGWWFQERQESYVGCEVLAALDSAFKQSQFWEWAESYDIGIDGATGLTLERREASRIRRIYFDAPSHWYSRVVGLRDIMQAFALCHPIVLEPWTDPR